MTTAPRRLLGTRPDAHLVDRPLLSCCLDDIHSGRSGHSARVPQHVVNLAAEALAQCHIGRAVRGQLENLLRQFEHLAQQERHPVPRRGLPPLPGDKLLHIRHDLAQQLLRELLVLLHISQSGTAPTASARAARHQPASGTCRAGPLRTIPVGLHASAGKNRLKIVTDHSTSDALDFSGYQQAAARTGAVIPTDHPIVYPTLGLANEAGEVAGKVKKIFRDRQGQITDADREALALELGDVLWYLSEICTRLGIRLEDVAARNIAKLTDRASRGVLSGEGDLR